MAAVLNLWLGGTVMVAAVINLAIAVLDYSPMRPGPNPTVGFLLAGLVLCIFVSCGVWGRFGTDPSARGCYSRSADDRRVCSSLPLRRSVICSLDKTQNGHTISTATGPQKPLREP